MYKITVSWYLMYVEQTVRNGNSIAWTGKRTPLNMLGRMLVSGLCMELFWTF